jgi:hypothetical protein
MKGDQTQIRYGEDKASTKLVAQSLENVGVASCQALALDLQCAL